MSHVASSYKSTRLSLVLSLFLAAFVVMFSTPLIAAEPSGYVSNNQADLPPSLEQDPSLRSTDPASPPAYGPEDARVLVVTFADFECPACRRASQATHQIASQFPGQVRMEFRNNPLYSHKTAEAAARAAMAAHEQGMFWEMHDLLFKNPRHDPATLEQNAVFLGLDVEKFREDMASDHISTRVKDDIALSESLGARRTPTFLVNGKFVEGWASWNYFNRLVGREVAKANAMAEQGMSTGEILDQRAIDNHSDSATYEIYRQTFLEPMAK